MAQRIRDLIAFTYGSFHYERIVLEMRFYHHIQANPPDYSQAITLPAQFQLRVSANL